MTIFLIFCASFSIVLVCAILRYGARLTDQAISAMQELCGSVARMNLRLREFSTEAERNRRVSILLVCETESGMMRLLGDTTDSGRDSRKATLCVCSHVSVTVKRIIVTAPPNSYCDLWQIGQNSLFAGPTNFAFCNEAFDALLANGTGLTIPVGGRMSWEVRI